DVEKSLRFIAEVHQRPVLWKKKASFYKDGVLRNDAWAEIAAKENMSTQEAKTMWKKLLCCYRSNKSKCRKSQQTGSDIFRPRWFAYEAMAFVNEATRDAVHTDTVSMLFCF
uniref:MADF domain-containing protein n=1 Tax=Anopheles epiroticus TaxID=199890 RepID=A0A182PWM6_9DIPT